MKQQIEIKGMSCGGCVQNVEKALRQIDGVNTVNVSLTPPQAVIEANHTINTEQLQHALTNAGAYSIAGKEVDKNTKKTGGSCCG